jgi:membrane protease YdiL (CAAX protease family)
MDLLNSPASIPVFLYAYLGMAFTLMITVFNYRTFLRRFGDFKSFLLYFSFFALTLFVLPVAFILLFAKTPSVFLTSAGFTLGRVGRGIVIAAVSVPFALGTAFIGSRDPAMQARYPFSKQACASPKKFILFETSYLFLYYLPWEFVFRGLLFFPLIPAIGLLPALALQTIVSTVYHIGHPDSEIFAALAAGMLFGLIAFWTRSFLYTVFIHGFVGIGIDLAFYVRNRRRPNNPK